MPPSQFARFCLLSLERARHGSKPRKLATFCLVAREGKHFDRYTLFAGPDPAIVGNVIEEIESSEETKQYMRGQMSNGLGRRCQEIQTGQAARRMGCWLWLRI